MDQVRAEPNDQARLEGSISRFFKETSRPTRVTHQCAPVFGQYRGIWLSTGVCEIRKYRICRVVQDTYLPWDTIRRAMSHALIRRFLFLNQPTARDYIPRQAQGTAIPRIIHQTCRSWEGLPSEVRANIATLRESNPDWDYRFYNDEAVSGYIRKEYGASVLAYFDRIDSRYGAARADLFRYLLMYREGGVYLDIKSNVRRPLDELILPRDRLILAQWSQNSRFKDSGLHDWDFAGKIAGGEFQQWHIICASGHPYLHQVIQSVMRNIDIYIPRMHGTGRTAVLRLSGPIAYTLAILPLLTMNLHRLVLGHEEIGLEYSIYPENIAHKQLFKTHYTELTAPIVQATLLRRFLSLLYGAFDRLRRK